jgi:hypothetical protein
LPGFCHGVWTLFTENPQNLAMIEKGMNPKNLPTGLLLIKT